ncbi:hypothetical protein AAMO2058_001641800 [Amorphochlora amoebiformis]
MALSLELITAIAAIVAVTMIWLWATSTSGPVRLNPQKYIPVKLIKKEVVSENCDRPTVFLTFDTNVENFPTGAHVSCRFGKGVKSVARPYTPTRFSPKELELMIRVYPEGKMTQHMAEMKVGETLDIKGPTGLRRYGRAGPGSFTKLLKSKEVHTTGIETILMFAGGTGITPMLQICNHIIKDPKDSTKVVLVVANSVPGDVMMYDEVKDLETRSKGAIKVEFTVSRPTEDWKHREGRICQQMITETCPGSCKKVVSVLCGPTPFEKAVTACLMELGHEKSSILRW